MTTQTQDTTKTSGDEADENAQNARNAADAQPAEDWRGVAAEGQDDIGDKASVFLRERSRKLLGDLLRPYRKLIALLIVAVVVENAARLAIPYLVKVGIDRGIPPLVHNEGATTLVTVVVALVVAAVTQAITRQLFLQLSGRIGQEVLLHLRRRIFNHFQKLSLSFHEKYTSGRVISRLTSDIEAIYELLQSGFDSMVSAVLTLVGTAVLLLILDVNLGLVALVPIPILLFFTQWFRKKSSLAYRRTRETVAVVIVHFVESMGGIRAVQAFRREPRNQQIFEKVNADYRDANMQGMRLIAVFMPGVKAIGNVTVAAVLLYGGWLAFHDAVTVGVLAAFLLYLRQFYEPMQEISQFYNTFQSASAALEKLSGVLEEKPEVAEPAEPVKLDNARGEVHFDHVEFGYVEGRPVLPELDLRMPAGQTVALVGATGAGKTTLAKLLSRFYDPIKGSVRLDGVDLRDLDEATLRKAVVMVTQENFLFTGSVADNIRFGRPNATMKEVVAAARAIGADEFIEALPDAYDTQVGKRGGRLSAGQRQLIAFARAFLADPAVLILDEATSSLDVPSERLVQRALRTILADRTALIIAHRLSTVEIADRVLVMEQGRVVEDGSPSQLIEQTGRFADLHNAWLESLA
ncbi:ABC-type multidrug transport system, ATPase and permease component [Actinopolymorpha cephalotaxi]|uniref:ABC-type multidrug transport system fused ATPase/permease subunit n=1 Tax=Actinopolymorpha cephalotaxi TaxID=504797 RepID=A0A1I2U7J9_9ACTN|nr:ABC transporter ATP-binding protein [Actinopolymorpha cephalotaxi]NYH86425.1 ABC-type multidrug transport system fused ATPase/permease subunit [Actinopolymorpha cephalotaxi]SFG71647.1 ABC-type multidrug transport system, ATPase and permease component [Actinopolymorpha cephalotaxi]